MTELIDVVGTFSMGTQDIMPEVDRMIKYEDLDFAPVTSFLASIGNTKQVANTIFNWPESRAETFQVTCTAIAGGAGTAGTQVAVTITGLVAIGQVLYHGPTRQRFMVTSFTSRTTTTTSCSVTKIPTSSDIVTISGTPTLRVLALQIPEGGYYPIGHGTRPTWFSNYTQLCTNVASVTKTMRRVATWYGDQFQKDIKEAIVQHRGNNERLLWFGDSVNQMLTLTNEVGHVSTGTYTQAQGIDSRIVSHRMPYTNCDKATFNAWLATHVFGSRNSGPKEAMLVCGPGAMQSLNDIAESPLVTFQGADDFGLDIKQWKTWGGRRLAIVEEREFMDNSPESGNFYKINPDNISINHLGPHFMEVFPVEPPDRDIDAICFRTEWGPEFKLEGQAALLYQLQ